MKPAAAGDTSPVAASWPRAKLAARCARTHIKPAASGDTGSVATRRAVAIVSVPLAEVE